MIEVWADIGGTFTDCLVLQHAGDAAPQRQSLKVLSSGRVTIDVEDVRSPTELLVRIPAALVREQFYNGAVVRQQSGKRLGTLTQCRLQQLADEPEERGHGGNRQRVLLTLDANHGVTGKNRDEPSRLTIDAGIEAPVLATRLLLDVALSDPLPELQVRLGTTRGTNALLTRGGAPTALLITEGLGDLLSIGTQDRLDLFNLDIVKAKPLPEHTTEVTGRLNAAGEEIVPMDEPGLRTQLQKLRESPDCPEVLAICFLHSYCNDVHERAAERIARQVGFQRIVRSTSVAPLPRIVPRAETCTLDAYLQPVLESYVRRVEQQFGGAERCQLRWMTSSGNLVASAGFRGRESVLSGPAGGVVALAEIAKKRNISGAVGIDMGGTSTDVSRYDGEIGRRQETHIGGIRVLAPTMDIHTVAAGGGSICGIRDGRLFVGPASAGADPGPACYGRGGPLTITDVNVLLDRLPSERFPFRLDPEASWRRLMEIHESLPAEITASPTQLAEGFLRIAVTEMAEAVRAVTTAAGNDVRKMALVGFGGAAGGHLCRVAEALGVSHVIDHPQAGILSAVGIGHAAIGRIVTQGFQRTIAPASAGHRCSPECQSELENAASTLRERCLAELGEEESLDELDVDDARLNVSLWCDVRYLGTQSNLELPLEPIDSLAGRMDAKHLSTFGYERLNMPIEIVSIRCEATLRRRESVSQQAHSEQTETEHLKTSDPEHSSPTGSVIDRTQLSGGESFQGPLIVASPHSILNVESGWTAKVGDDGVIELHRCDQTADSVMQTDQQHNNAGLDTTHSAESVGESAEDAIEMEVVSRRVQGIAEAMGEVIRRTSVSVNVKERRDYSCAVFLGDGSLIANAPHVPVHLGAMGHTVRSMIESFPNMQNGDCFVSNDPFAGGSHLPDVTVVTPVFCDSQMRARPHDWTCDYFVASRCHHAEIGGMVPGSMAPEATCLADEGVLIRNRALTQNGQSHHEALRALLSSGKYPSRNVEENMADIAAAEAAGREGARAIISLADSLPPGRLAFLCQRLMRVAGEATATWIESLGDQPRDFSDQLDDGTPICVTLRPDSTSRQLTIDFTGSGEVHPHGFNATRSIVTAAVLYVLRCVAENELPLCDGVLERIELAIPQGLLDPPGDLDPQLCPAVVAGNVETSNRVVDVLLGALGVAGASQGTMNNLLIGDETFGYYETIGGGAGATANADGADAVHTHMTNTRITDPEVLESRLPVRLWCFSIRRHSGGAGCYRGGDGMLRELEFLKPLTLSLLTSRRTTTPYGMQGGQPGQPGQQTLIRGGQETPLGGCISISVQTGERLRVETPGGGGFG